MFVDLAKIRIASGKGGNGKISFRREKYVAAGGPDGGDGGRGGSVIFLADDHLSTLLDFRYRKKYIAASGEDGDGKRKKGKDGADLIIRVPRGTVLRDPDTGLIIKDLSDGEPFVAAKGGNGGWGNTHFSTGAPLRETRSAGHGTRNSHGVKIISGRWISRVPEYRKIYAAEYRISRSSENRELSFYNAFPKFGRCLHGRRTLFCDGGYSWLD